MSNVQSLIAAEHTVLSHDPALLSLEACLVRDGVTLTATQRYVYQHWLAAQLQTMYDECECRSCTDQDEADACVAQVASLEADDARDAAREAWLASDEERDWRVADDQASWMVEGLAPSDIEERLEDEAAQYDRDDPREPMLYSLDAAPIDPVTGEADRREGMGVSGCLDGEEPDCEDGHSHDWQTPHSVLGGLGENPGVWGAGAGIISREVCAHCGAYRVYESHRQDGSGGYHAATSYEDSDDASETWVAARRREARTEALVTALEDEYEEDALRAAIGTALDEDEDATEDDVRALIDADADEDEDEDEEVAC